MGPIIPSLEVQNLDILGRCFLVVYVDANAVEDEVTVGLDQELATLFCLLEKQGTDCSLRHGVQVHFGLLQEEG